MISRGLGVSTTVDTGVRREEKGFSPNRLLELIQTSADTFAEEETCNLTPDTGADTCHRH